MDEQQSSPKAASEVTTTDTSSAPAETAIPTSDVATPVEPVVQNNHVKYAVGILIAGALVAGGYLWYQNQDQSTTSAYPDVVAVVNGTEISADTFEQSVARTTELAVAQGALPTDPTVRAQIEEQAIDVLVNTTLFLEAAREAGITTTPEAVAEQYILIQEQFGGEAALAAELERQNMTPADLNADIEEQLIVDEYITTEAGLNELEVTAEEIQAFYDSIPAGENVPSLEELAPQIEQQIQANTQQEAVQNLIDMLRMNAVIEVNLE